VIDTGGGNRDGIKKKMKKQEATLLKLKFILNNLGQVVVEKSTIDPKLFRKAFDNRLPEYPNTIILENFITRINNLTDKFIEDAEIF
jgi:hypothetical protein|tara:strand:+ start:811 stop:1071 length:261 start_codon:yes stop_codon:yes gene_type:complete